MKRLVLLSAAIFSLALLTIDDASAQRRGGGGAGVRVGGGGFGGAGARVGGGFRGGAIGRPAVGVRTAGPGYRAVGVGYRGYRWRAWAWLRSSHCGLSRRLCRSWRSLPSRIGGSTGTLVRKPLAWLSPMGRPNRSRRWSRLWLLCRLSLLQRLRGVGRLQLGEYLLRRLLRWIRLLMSLRPLTGGPFLKRTIFVRIV